MTTEKKKSVLSFKVIISLIIYKEADIYVILAHSHSTPLHATQNDKEWCEVICLLAASCFVKQFVLGYSSFESLGYSSFESSIKILTERKCKSQVTFLISIFGPIMM